MQFLYHPEAGRSEVWLYQEFYHYLFKVRRHKRAQTVALRNLQDDYLYIYRIEEVRRREALLRLVDQKFLEIKPKRFFHLLWCIVDPKTVEKTLPTLNEIGVGKISFLYCARTQKNFTLNMEKLRKILINSSQQCGRSELMELEILSSLEEALQRYKDIVLIDFYEKKLTCNDNIQRALIGPEGGISDEERKLFTQLRGLDSEMILRSESAAIVVASKVLV